MSSGSTPTWSRARGGVIVAVALALAAGALAVTGPAASGEPATTQVSTIATTASTTATTAKARKATSSKKPRTGRYSPSVGVKFNHWNMKSNRNKIRRHVLRTIRSVPPGGTIRWMVFSFGDNGILDALLQARKRGVSVQVIGNFHNRETWEPWRRLERALGTKRKQPGKNPERISWAYMCKKSCRGYGGHEHMKLFLFSSAGKSSDIVMYGSWNPTWVANQRQWNHLETMLDPQTYRRYMKIFRQAKADKPKPYTHWVSGGREHMVFPKTRTWASTDPVNKDLGKIKCKGVTNGAGRNGHTMIRIGMYAWYQKRGDWMARRVRDLWNKGCDVAIVYGIMSDRARRILYSPSGRGRIPMKQAMVPDKKGYPYRYLHDKFVAVSGVYDGQTDAQVVWAGSTNFSNLGFAADDMTVRNPTPTIVQAYFKDFQLTWKGRNVHKPHPTSVVNAEARTAGQGPMSYSNELPDKLGEGVLRHMEAD